MARIDVKKGETLIAAIDRSRRERIAEIVSDAAIANAKTCEAAILAERERCAKVAETATEFVPGYPIHDENNIRCSEGSKIARLIRTQSEWPRT